MRTSALLAVFLATAANVSLAANGEPLPLYLGATAHYYAPDSDQTSGKGSGGELFVGFPLSIFYGGGSLEIGGFGTSVGEDAPVPKFTLSGGELLLRGILSDGSSLSTFVLLGGGYQRNDEFQDDPKGFVTGGMGLLVPLGGRGLYLRGEGRMYAQRARSTASNPEDLLFSYRAALGFEYSFADAAYAPAQPVPPPPPPPAAPVAAPLAAAPILAAAPTDSDFDGVTDTVDRCPGTPRGTPVDLSGCPVAAGDSDRDGVPDDSDRCANTPAGVSVDEFGCPPTLDSDGDGIVDSRDRCAGTPVGAQVDFQGCPQGVADADGDGVGDRADRCPGTARGVSVDATGCPISNDQDRDGVPNASDLCPDTPARMRVDGDGCVIQQSVSFSNITFKFNSSELTAGAREVLDGIAAGLKSQPTLSVGIAGHTDSVGTPAQNMTLSKARARAVMDYLSAHGVSAGRLHADGYGETRPVASNNSESGRAQNRRVEFNIRR